MFVNQPSQKKTLLGFLLSCLMIVSAAQAETSIFAQLSIPGGVTTDQTGNVYVHSDAITTTQLTKFRQDGTPISRVTLGGINISEFVGSRLTRIPNTDAMLLLSPEGVIYLYTPDLRFSVAFDLRSQANQIYPNVYDIQRQGSHPLNLGFPQYGDIAARWVNNQQLDLFLTATTGPAGGFPFVMRIRIDFANNVNSVDVILTSQGTTAGNVNLAPGIAVNNDGTVLTSMPFPSGLGFADSLVAFGADFPQDPNATTPQFILQDPNTQSGIVDLASSGMTVDEGGNFYIATGVVGSSICGPNASGALVFIDRQLTQPSCFPVGGAILRSMDVAVSPVDNSVYMTISDFNGAVLRFDPIVPPIQNSGGGTGQ